MTNTNSYISYAFFVVEHDYLEAFIFFSYPGQPPILATAQSPQPQSTSAPAPGNGGQIVTAMYPPSSSVTMATGVLSMTAAPPSVVYSVSSPSSTSPHILPKHTHTSTTVTHPHPDRLLDRHLPPDRPPERQSDRPQRHTEMLTHLDRQLERQPQPSSISSTVAPPSGSNIPIKPCSPQLQIQTSGTCASVVKKYCLNCFNHSNASLFFFLLQLVLQVHQSLPSFQFGLLRK